MCSTERSPCCSATSATKLRPEATRWSRRGNVHTVSNPGDVPARFLNVSVPSGLDTYLRELAAADPSQYASIAARHDVIVA